ncbi:MAG: RpoL/Rpb11 RNA polymerase subunit family protein [Candidatus Hadarchaeaceae archaeon]
MELEIIEKGDEALLIKVREEDHTLCNLLRKTLLSDKYVVAASYAIEHPLSESPKFYVKTKKGKTPERALMDAAGQLAEQLKELQKQLQQELKK